MAKVLLLSQNVSHYNIHLFNKVSDFFSISVAYTHKDESIAEEVKFDKIKLPYFSLFDSIYFNLKLIKLCNRYDVVIIMPDMHYISYVLLPFLPKRRFKVISWGIGFRASYTLNFDVNRKHNFLDRIYKLILQNCDANIFYSTKAIEFWKNINLGPKIFVANNTVYLPLNLRDSNVKKELILFVGTLYKEKGIEKLLKAYSRALNSTNVEDFPKFVIIGTGPLLKEIKAFIFENNLENSILVLGAIYDEAELSKYFNKAIAFITPEQAGLSVLKSLFYGVPVVTSSVAITGGELYNIVHEHNGILLDHDEELYKIICRCYFERQYFLELGNNAKSYFDKNATFEIQLNNFIQAINSVLF